MAHDRREAPQASSDPVYRQLVITLEMEGFDKILVELYEFLNRSNIGYRKLRTIPELGVVPIELSEGEDVLGILAELNGRGGVKVAEQNRYLGLSETIIPPPM